MYRFSRMCLLSAVLGLVAAPMLALTRDEAKSIVMAQVISQSPFQDTLVAYSYAAGPDGTLKPGDVVEPLVPITSLTVQEDSWFFWLDYTPARWFVHPAAFVLVSDATSQVTVVDVEWFPVINDELIYSTFQERTTSPDIFFGDPVPPAAAVGNVIEFTLGRGQTEGGGTKWAVLATGPADHTVANADVELMKGALMDGQGVPAGNISKPKGTKMALMDALDALANQDPPCDKLYFHFTGHGNRDFIVFGPPYASPAERLTYQELADKIKGTKAKSFCVSIESCRSGGGLDELRDTLEGTGVTSTDEDEFARMTATGSVFTKAFAACLTDEDADVDDDSMIDYTEAYNWAKEQSDDAEDQKPQIWGAFPTLFFPQFGNGLGFSSDIVLVNSAETGRPVTGRLQLLDPDGKPLDVPFTDSTGLDFSIGPLDTQTFRTTGEGGLAVGSAAVKSDGASLGGVVRFAIPGFGVAGVGAGPSLNAAIVPVRNEGAIRSAIAIRNTSGTSIDVLVTLRISGETTIRSVSINLPRNGRDAQFVDEIFDLAGDFTGSAVLQSERGSFAALALEQGDGVFTTLPVTPLK